MTRLLVLLATVLLTGCVAVPDGIEPVRDFDAERYLGTWYEIARLDHGFERGLTHVRARYTPREDGGITVTNRGWDTEEEAWDEARGRAYFVEDARTGYLKVSFFGPFYGAYVVFELDPDYRWALVTGPNRNYLWLLARDPLLDPALRDSILERAEAAGFDLEELILVPQDDPPPGA
jgi:apolipoprotein D and lipocalin family protein